MSLLLFRRLANAGVVDVLEHPPANDCRDASGDDAGADPGAGGGKGLLLKEAAAALEVDDKSAAKESGSAPPRNWPEVAGGVGGDAGGGVRGDEKDGVGCDVGGGLLKMWGVMWVEV